MQKWEYKVIVIDRSPTEDALNKLGAEGWELVSVGWDYRKYVLKRRTDEK